MNESEEKPITREEFDRKIRWLPGIGTTLLEREHTMIRSPPSPDPSKLSFPIPPKPPAPPKWLGMKRRQTEFFVGF